MPRKQTIQGKGNSSAWSRDRDSSQALWRLDLAQLWLQPREEGSLRLVTSRYLASSSEPQLLRGGEPCRPWFRFNFWKVRWSCSRIWTYRTSSDGGCGTARQFLRRRSLQAYRRTAFLWIEQGKPHLLFGGHRLLVEVDEERVPEVFLKLPRPSIGPALLPALLSHPTVQHSWFIISKECDSPSYSQKHTLDQSLFNKTLP